MNYIDYIDYYNPLNTLNLSTSEDNAPRKEYVLYGCLSDFGITGGNNLEGQDSIYYPTEFYLENIEKFVGSIVDIDHRYNKYSANSEKEIRGEVIDAFNNTEGYTTNSGQFVKADLRPHCKIKCNLTEEEYKNIKGFSCFFTPILDSKAKEINNVDCKLTVQGINTNEPIGVSVCISTTPRMNKTRAVYNSVENNLEKKLDNYNNDENIKNNMNEEEIKSIKAGMAEMAEDIKSLKEMSQKKPELENSEAKEPTTENTDAEAPASQDVAVDTEIKEMITQGFTAVNGKIDELLKTLTNTFNQKAIENNDAMAKQQIQNSTINIDKDNMIINLI